MVADNSTTAVPRPRQGGAAPVPHDVLADPAATADAYRRHIEATGMSPATIRAYSRQVAAFCTWLAAAEHHDPGETFTDPYSRDFATRDYRTHLTGERNLAPASVDAALSALDSFYTWLGLGRTTVKRVQGRGDASSKFGEHLTKAQARDVMRAAERRGPRDLAMVGLMMLAGLRVGELVRVNMDDWWAQARSGQVQVRGKAGKHRTVDLNSSLRPLLVAWEVERRSWPRASEEPALFLSAQGQRIARRTVHYSVALIGKRAGVPTLHPHQLRHTCAHGLLAAGRTMAEVQRVLGHSDVRTTQSYVQPSREEAAAAMDALVVEW